MIRRTTDSLVAGFAGAPALLLIVILNVTMLGIFGYAVLQMDRLRNERAAEITGLLRACVNRELDLGDIARDAR